MNPGTGGTPPLPKKLQQAIAENASFCFVDLPVLSAADVATLKRLLRGDARPSFAVDRKRAVVALANNDRSDEAAHIMARMLGDRAESLRVRSAAAASLRLLTGDTAEEALLANLRTEEPVLRSEIIESLAAVGSARSLTALEQLPAPPCSDERALIDFARTAIASRTPSPSGVPPIGGQWVEQRGTVLEPDQAGEYLRALYGSTYGMDLDPSRAIELSCAGSPVVVFPDRKLASMVGGKAIAPTPTLVGLVALREPGVAHLTVRNLIFATASRDGLEIQVARPTGAVALSGVGRIDAQGLRVSLRDVGIERVPTVVEATITSKGIEFIVRTLSGGTVRAKRGGVPIQVSVE